jgi:hypothetical protein
VTVSGFDQPFIVDKGKGIRNWEKLKAALAKESGRLRDLAELRARPRQCPNTENDQPGELPSLSIDAIFGLGFPAEGTFDQFTEPFKDEEMFDAPADSDRSDATSRLSPLCQTEP